MDGGFAATTAAATLQLRRLLLWFGDVFFGVCGGCGKEKVVRIGWIGS